MEEGKKIARFESIEELDYENALMIISFRYAGTTNILAEGDTKWKLLNDFATQINYPEEDLQKVQAGIEKNINLLAPISIIENVAWDAIAYRLTDEDLIIHMSFLKEEINSLNETQYTETAILKKVKDELVKSSYYTQYAKENYTEKRDKNFNRLEKRIVKLQQAESKSLKENTKPAANFSNKETEDLFKIAFRNYVNLVSVADSKAGLLINVNSTIISVVIAFVVSRTEKYPFLTLPSFMLLAVAFITILLSILASRPQKNFFIQDKSSKSYQTFFFGSFDLMGNEFSKATWDNYSVELDELLKGGKENVYEEMYKETFNVRKVLGRKFTLLSYAYLVFIIGYGNQVHIIAESDFK